MFASKKIDAVIIATPHFFHAPLAIQAMEAGLHVLVEKPVCVQKSEGERMFEAHRKHSKLVFSAMFQQRLLPAHQKVKQLIDSGELGELFRVNWTITDWFRSEAYYASGGWRATWAGEGGGVLINQCPHQLDLFQWFFGMPCRVRAFCHFGRYHDIEVEDDVTAYLEYANGMNAIFTASTGEMPGTNRLEISADRGRLILEDRRALEFLRNEVPAREFSSTTERRMGIPKPWKISIEPEAARTGHAEIIGNFARAIQGDEELVAPAMDGLHSVELANAILLSAFEDRTVELPMDSAHFEKVFAEKQKHSRFKPGQ